MTAPVRLQLSRWKGFRLQDFSRATNGLPAVNVARPGPWGNRYRIGPMTREEAVKAHREWLCEVLAAPSYGTAREALAHLRGHNLACWCALTDPCHADTLLELANT